MAVAPLKALAPPRGEVTPRPAAGVTVEREMG